MKRKSFKTKKREYHFWQSTPNIHPAVVAEWVYEQLQIQEAESHRSQVRIPLGAMKISK